MAAVYIQKNGGSLINLVPGAARELVGHIQSINPCSPSPLLGLLCVCVCVYARTCVFKFTNSKIAFFGVYSMRSNPVWICVINITIRMPNSSITQSSPLALTSGK